MVEEQLTSIPGHREVLCQSAIFAIPFWTLLLLDYQHFKIKRATFKLPSQQKALINWQLRMKCAPPHTTKTACWLLAPYEKNFVLLTVFLQLLSQRDLSDFHPHLHKRERGCYKSDILHWTGLLFQWPPGLLTGDWLSPRWSSLASCLPHPEANKHGTKHSP